jgi:hypothetical protein
MKRSSLGRLQLATEVRALASPFATFAVLSSDPREGPRRLAARVALLLLVIGVGVSILTSGRVSLHHVIGSMFAWSFAPGIQLVAASLGIHLTAREPALRRDLRRLLSIYSAGNGPWLALFAVLPSAMVLAPDKDAVVRVGVERGVVPFALAVALAAGVLLTFAFHREVLRSSRARAAVGTLIDLVVKVVLSLVWFGWMDNLIPQLFGAGR